MNQFQNVKFGDIDEFLDFLPEDELEIVEFLRAVVFDCISNCREKLSYNVPYYYRHSRICFIWPASVPWGNVKQKGVLFGFCNGNLLTDDLNWLDKGKRKYVYTKTFTKIEQIDIDLLKTYIFEAVEVDEKLKKK